MFSIQKKRCCLNL